MASLEQKNNDYYRKLIVKHYSTPSNKGLLKTKDSLSFHHYTNSCVDDFYIELTFDKDKVTACKFDGIGCAISSASIDMFCTMVESKPINQLEEIVQNYQLMLDKKPFKTEVIGDLIAFENVLKQPNRIKCALIIAQSISEILLLKVK